MSGRAGRRGKDDRGICIIMVDEQVISHFFFKKKNSILLRFFNQLLVILSKFYLNLALSAQ